MDEMYLRGTSPGSQDGLIPKWRVDGAAWDTKACANGTFACFGTIGVTAVRS